LGTSCSKDIIQQSGRNLFFPARYNRKGMQNFCWSRLLAFQNALPFAQGEILLDKVPSICTRRFLQAVYIAPITQMEKV
jgi:hypothetical protein